MGWRVASRAGQVVALVGAVLVSSGCAAVARLIPIEVASSLASQGDSGEQEKPARDPRLNLYATVFPLLVRSYDDPATVSRCITTWADPRQHKEDTLQVLLSIGVAREFKFSPAERMAFETLCNEDLIDSLAPVFDCTAPAPPAARVVDVSTRLLCPGLGDTDRRLLAHAVLQLGDALHGQFLSMWPTGSGSAPPEYAEAFAEAAMAAADTLSRTPASVARSASNQRPVLALSGGAANGAFIAGFMYRLLSWREQARAAYLARGDTAAVHQIDDDERFDAIVSTSVGSLIAPATDLYFADVRATKTELSAEERKVLEQCLGTHAPPGRPPPERITQACVLRLLRHYFTYSNEWDLMCAENGNIGGLVGLEGVPKAEHRTNFFAFDPMRHRIVKTFFENFYQRTLTNDVQLEVMAVDVKQRVTMALDERACTGRAVTGAVEWGPRSIDCLLNNTTASLVEPVLSRDVSAVYTGLSSYKGCGEKGQWLDGGLRTGSPVLRALQLTRWPAVTPRFEGQIGTAVLAVSTHRSEGTPTTRRSTLPALAFDTVGNFAEQLRVWELGSIGAFAQVQWQEMAAWSPPKWPTRKPQRQLAMPAATPGGVVDSVVVPENIVAGRSIDQAMLGEYAFDPVTMTRLFVLGEQTLVNVDPAARLERMGWERVRAWLLEDQNLKRAREELEKRAKLANSAFDATGYKESRAEGQRRCFHECLPDGEEDRAPLDAECTRDLLPAELAGARPSWPW